MKLTRVDLYNLTLGNIKIGQKVGSLDDETARTFQLPQNYDVALATLLSMHDWSFAAVLVKLARLADAPVLLDGMRTPWRYAWAYPSNCVRVLAVGTMAGDALDFTGEWPWLVANGSGGRSLYTTHDHACARYLSDAVPVSDWPAAFVAAFTWTLASTITRAVNADDADADYRMKQAAYYFEQAKIADVKEAGAVPPRRGGWMEARNA